MSNFTVIYDACVLYPSPLRSFLMYLAVTDLFRARWTDEIHEEWVRNVLANHGHITPEKLERTRNLMDAHVRGAKVTGHMQLIPSLELPDEDDRHVLAAAITCGAQAIVTFNRRHFPASKLQPWGVEAVHPDDFLNSQLRQNPTVFCRAARSHRTSMKNPPMDAQEFLDLLERQQLLLTVEKLREYEHLI